MDAVPAADLEARVRSSPLLATYGTRLDPDSAREVLARRMESAAAAGEPEEQEAPGRASAQDEYERAQREFERAERAAEERRAKRAASRTTSSRRAGDPLSDLLGSDLGGTIAKEVVRGIFATLRRRR